MHSGPQIPIPVARGMFLICSKERALPLQSPESTIVRVVVMNILFFVTNLLKLRDCLMLRHINA